MSAALEPKWDKFVVQIKGLGDQPDQWLGPFNSAQEAEEYSRKRFPPQFLANPVERKGLCGQAIHPTKKVTLPKKVKGYIWADYKGRPWGQDVRRHRQYPTLASKGLKPMVPGKVLAHESHGQERGCGSSGFLVGLGREGALEKIGCYRPQATAEMTTSFLSVVDKNIDPACRLFEVEAKIEDVYPHYGDVSMTKFKVIKEIDAQTAATLRKKHKDFYDTREELEAASLKMTPAIIGHAKKYLDKPNGNLVKAMFLLANEERVFQRREYREGKVLKSVQQLTDDDKFMKHVIKILPIVGLQDGEGVVRAMILISAQMRKELIEKAIV